MFRSRAFCAFVLVLCFGILFAGCKGPEDVPNDEFVFTEQDVARFRELAQDAEAEATGSGVTATQTTGSGEDVLTPLPTASGGSMDTLQVPDLDLSMVASFDALRTSPTIDGGNIYRVTNEFVNVRSEPKLSAALVERIERGAAVDVMEFVNAGWAKVKTASGKEGFVSKQYIAKLTSAEKLADEKMKFQGLYFVNFAFVNIRKEANQNSEKLGEIPGQTIIRPQSMEGQWAKVSFEGKDGFVSTTYLAPFMPVFNVRQETYQLPIIQYQAGQEGMLTLMKQHVARLKQDGAVFTTLRSFQDLLVNQEQRDARLAPKSIVVAITGITGKNVKEVSAALQDAGITATLFIETKQLGIAGITEKTVSTLIANGYDVESAGHTGDDLRSLTNAQVELELKQSRKMLEQFTHRPIISVAYPQGGANDRVMELAADSGYLFGVTSASDRTFGRSQLLNLPSFVIFPSTTDDEVARLIAQ